MKNYWERINELQTENRQFRNAIEYLEELYRATDLCEKDRLSAIEEQITELREAVKKNCLHIERLRYDYKCSCMRNEPDEEQVVEIRKRIYHDGFIVAIKF